MTSLILAIETSASMCSVALVKDGSLIGEVSETLMHGQAARFMALVAQLFSTFSYDIQQVTHVVVNRGPGSFTGIRLGLAAAYGFASAGNIPLLGVTSFQIHRHKGQGNEGPILIALDTRRDDFYTCFYKPHSTDYEWARVVNLEGLKQCINSFKSQKPLTLLTDKNEDIFKEGLTDKQLQVHAQILTAKDGALMADGFLKTSCMRNTFSKEPFYLRPAAVYENPPRSI